MADYLADNRLSLNATKTEFMIIGSKQRVKNFDQVDLNIQGQHIERVSQTKYLGVTIDSNITWSKHIETMYKRLSSKIGILRRIRHCVPKYCLVTIYNSFILPLFDYCDIIFDSADKKHLDKLQILQNRSARIILGAHRLSHREDMFKKLGWLSLQNRRKLHKAVMMYKVIRGLAPDYLNTSFKQRNQIHTYQTRFSSHIQKPIPYSKSILNSFQFSGANLWNSIPDHIKTTESLDSFKLLYKKYLKSQNQF